jgi:L-ascorbate metabolism protein UlaG (beta-lactamase superfamily)
MRFHNLDPSHQHPGAWAAFRWKVLERQLRRRAQAAPGQPAACVAPNLAAIHDRRGPPRLTWIGHASILGTLGEETFLVDPVFSARIGWRSFTYPRHAPPGLTAGQLPPIDLLLVTHNHYDHLDEPSLAALDRSTTVIVPSRLGGWFCRAGFARVIELAWWERATVGGLRVTCIPARHWSRRGVFDTNRSHWCGFVVEKEGVAVYHAGDTAWFDTFDEIGRRFPNLSAALLPIGGCEPRWFMRYNHMSPEEAGEAQRRLGARRLVPIHWGTFQLSDEALREPAERLRAWWDRQVELPGQLHVPAVGEVIYLPA